MLGVVLGILLGGSFSRAQQKPAPATTANLSPMAALQGSQAPAAKPPAASPAPAGKSALNQAPATRPPAAPAGSEQRGKRRDPFHTLIPEKRQEEAAGPIHLPPGKKGLVIEQLQLQGIARAVDGSWIAVVDNKSKRAYFLHEKDQLYNGVVSKITPDKVVFLENAPEASGRAGSREVVKQLPPE